jgi:hypothetical protein
MSSHATFGPSSQVRNTRQFAIVDLFRIELVRSNSTVTPTYLVKSYMRVLMLYATDASRR